jgi:hypothetical protein
MFRRRLRFMLDGYMLANNIERPRDRGEPSTSSTESGQRKARSPVHPRIPPTSRVPSPPRVPSPSRAPDEPAIPDAVGESDPTPPDTGWDPLQQDNIDNDTQVAGPRNVSPLPGPSDVAQRPESPDTSQHLGPSDASQLPDADYTGPPEDIELAELRIDDGDTVSSIRLPKLQTTQKFIDLLRTASLDDSGMDSEALETLRNPQPMIDLLDPSPILCSLRHFINNAGSSRDHFDNLRAIELLNDPKSKLLSFDQVKRRIRHLSGVVPVEYDMCPNSCVAFTGPYCDLDKCPTCQTSRYHPDLSKPQKQFWTVLIGPVIQAFYGSCHGSAWTPLSADDSQED